MDFYPTSLSARKFATEPDGPNRWLRLSYSFEQSIFQETSIAIGNSTSIRISAAYTPSSGPSFQSSHTQMN